MKRLGRFWRVYSKQLLLITIITVAVGFVLLYKLGSLSGGLAPAEAQQITFSSSWHTIAHNPLNAPLTVVQWLLLKLSSHHGQTITRLPSALFGLLTLLSFFYILRRWYGIRSAVFGIVLFGLSSWFLHVSRLATPDVLYLWAAPTLLALHILWQRQVDKPAVTFLAVAVLGLLLYIPGIIWLVVLGLTLQPHDLGDAWKRLPAWWQRTLLVLLVIIILAPLAWACWRAPWLIRSWAGLPAAFGTPLEILRRLGDSVSYLFYHGPPSSVTWLGRLPVLDYFCMAMLLLGIYFYSRHILAPRTRLLFGIFIVGAVFFALGGPVAYSVVVPIVYLIIAGGVGYLLHEWLKVFPRNPLARNVGFGLLGLAIVLACTYNFRAYFIAWPHNSITESTFDIHR